MRETRFGFNTGEIGPEFHGRGDVERYELAAARIENFVVRYSGSLQKRPGFRHVAAAPTGALRLFPFAFSDDPANAYVIVFLDGKIAFLQNGGYVVGTNVNVTNIIGGVVTTPSVHTVVAGDILSIPTLTREVRAVAPITSTTFGIEELNGDPVTATSFATTFAPVYTITHPYSNDDLRSLVFSVAFDQIKITHRDYNPRLLSRSGSTWTLTIETRNGGKPLAGAVSAVSSGKFIKAVQVTAKGTGYALTTTLGVSDANGSGAQLIPIIDTGEVVGVTIVDGGSGYTAPSITTANEGGGTGATFDITLAQEDAEVVFSVSANINGKETGIFRPVLKQNILNVPEIKGAVTFNWPAVTGAESYNVYRSLFAPFQNSTHIGADLFYIGTVRGTSLLDANITPDSTRVPRIYVDPFARARVLTVEVTAGGSGYSPTDTISVSGGGGFGFLAYPIVLDGVVIGVYIADHGRAYTSAPTLTVVSSGGTGATLVATVSPDSGSFPNCSAIFQERAIYGGSTNEPLQVTASRLFEFDNFAPSRIPDASDPYSYVINTLQQTEMRHFVPLRQGLLVFTRDFVTLLRGEDGIAVTPLNGVFETVTALGASLVPPVMVEESVIYVTSKNRSIQMLRQTERERGFAIGEISFFARHIFQNVDVVAMTSTVDENNLVYGVLSDGSGFIATIHDEQRTYAFTRFNTQGLLKDIAAVSVGDSYDVYAVVERNGMNFVEYITAPLSAAVVDQLHLDGALTTTRRSFSAPVTLSGLTGRVLVDAGTGAFTALSVGDVFGYGDGVGFIDEIIDADHAYVQLLVPATKLVYAGNECYFNPLVTSVSGIPHEGAMLRVVGDGKDLGTANVVNGTVTLSQPAAMVAVGFDYRAELELLRPADSFGKKLLINGVEIRSRSAGNLTASNPSRAEYRPLSREAEAYSLGNTVKKRVDSVGLSGSWGDDGEVVITSDGGLPCEILQTVVFYSETRSRLDTPPPPAG